MKKIVILFFCIILLIGCSESRNIDYNNPENVLIAYFEFLSKEDYESLITVYGGSYELLQGYHPDVDPNNHAELFRRYINITGGQIVQIKEIVDQRKIADDEYLYTLTFLHADGTEFHGGMEYSYTVKLKEGKFMVMDIPPYLS